MDKKITHIHLVGIGGIGMSGIAQILRQQGYYVSGCDAVIEQKNVYNVQKMGCIVYKGNNTPACLDSSIDLVVYSTAVQKDSPELLHAYKRRTEVIHRSQLLASLMNTKYGIAITGSHGKTTTSSLLAHILIEAGTDPTIVLGGHLHSIDNNARLGTSELLVAEADESDRSLLNLQPRMIVLTNIDFEHAETYLDLNDLTETFKQFLLQLPPHGRAILCADDPVIQSILPLEKVTQTTYGFCKEATWRIADCSFKNNHSIFFLVHKTHRYGPIEVPLYGTHNVLNSAAAFVATHELAIAPETIIKALRSFTGVDRRFTLKGVYNGAQIVDDYGHHPTEIKHALATARAQTQGKVKVLFQPHRYTRTQKFWNEFIKMFVESAIDELIITDIFPANEAPLSGVTGELLAKTLKEQLPPFSVHYIPCEENFSSLISHFTPRLQEGDMLLLQGAGKANHLARHLLKK